ncbi:MAG TPA: serine/threonine-protein kinase [Kofleriaceae bacterium]|nr:serine/threonine-protein kinase [Kofleriaceae bacterium]
MADCQLCGSHHKEDICPQARTGQVIDNYVVGTLLGVGGIAAVYNARHLKLGREIAMKILHKRWAKDHELASRFVREGKETAALGHPAFVTVFDAGTTEDGCAYIEMDKLAGRDLYAVRTQDGPLAVDRVVSIAIQVLDGLAVLHARGTIHRDLKSSNIYLSPSELGGDRVILLDLGFAKLNDNSMALTQKDQMLGTPFYISPEQYLDPTEVDARADLFSLGIVMWEVLVGDFPYQWENKRDLLANVMHGKLERHPAVRRPDIPAWLDTIIATVLAHKREDRFENALAMKAALETKQLPDKPGLLKRMFGR